MQMIQVLLQSRALQRRYVVEVRAVAVEIKAALSEELQEHLREGSTKQLHHQPWEKPDQHLGDDFSLIFRCLFFPSYCTRPYFFPR